MKDIMKIIDIDPTKLQAMIDLIIANSKERKAEDNEDFNIFDYSGENIDDAFHMGTNSGRVEFARFLSSVIEQNLI